MKKISIVCMAIFFMGCSEEYDCCAHMEMNTAIEMSVFNENGEDLLDPNTPDAYREADIKLFYEIDGEIIEVNNPNGFHIFQNNNQYRLGLALNYAQNENQPTTYIQWSDTDTDTLKAEFRYPGQNVILEKLWFNGELKDTYFFEVEK